MLRALEVRDFVLIEHASLELAAGFVALAIVVAMTVLPTSAAARTVETDSDEDSAPSFDAGATLAAVASLPAGSSIVLDYLVPPAQLDPALRLVLRVLSALVAVAGEPLKSHFTAQQMQALLARHGFTRIDDLGPEALNARFFQGRTDALAVGSLGRVVCAWR